MRTEVLWLVREHLPRHTYHAESIADVAREQREHRLRLDLVGVPRLELLHSADEDFLPLFDAA